MQKIWFIFNFTTLALLIWDVINASPRQLISLCRKLSPPFHQNSVTLAPVCSVVMQLGYQGNPKVLIFFCYIAARQKFLYHKPFSLFLANKEVGFFFSLKMGHIGVKQRLLSRQHMSTSTQCCIRLFLTCSTAANWLVAENSLLLQVEVFQSCPLGKGIFVKANLYKWEMCASLGLTPFLSLAFCLIQTNTPQHIFSTCTPFIPPTVTVKWLNILINCI